MNSTSNLYSDSRRSEVNPQPSDPISKLVWAFLNSNLSLVLVLLAAAAGFAALWITPREEDPQIVVPLADIYVQFPGHKAAEVEQLVSTPLERMLYQIDGVEYVYSMSRDDSAIITVRFFVGQDRERSLVKLFKKLNENQQSIPVGVTGWVMKPVEIDDVPVVSLALTGAGGDTFALRRVGEEVVERLSTTPQVSRASIVGGEPRTISISLDPDRLAGFQLSVLDVQQALKLSNEASPAAVYARENRSVQIAVAPGISRPEEVRQIVVGVFDNRPVFLKDVAEVSDGPDEVTTYVRHGWGSSHGFEKHPFSPGWILGESETQHPSANPSTLQSTPHDGSKVEESTGAVVIAVSKQKGANAVHVAHTVIREAERLQREILPADMKLIVTRNNGMVADEKVNELVEALGVAIIIVVLLLTIGLGWREALIVSVAVPVVFGLTLVVNLLAGYTINRVTLFALILALGLLVDDPIVDVENIARHFEHRKKRSRGIVLSAVSEIRPPLISATLAVIVSFLPMFFITGMMGPYMSPMALNVPVAMLMSMLVAFTITPWLSFHVLGWGKQDKTQSTTDLSDDHEPLGHEAYDPVEVQRSFLYKLFRPLVLPLLRTKWTAILFLGGMLFLTFAAMGLGALRMVPLKMLPFDNKNEILFLLNMPEGTSLETTDKTIRELEKVLARQPETIDYISTVGVAGPIDFNGMVRHYYLRNQPHQGEVRVNFVGKKNRKQQSHAIGLRIRDELLAIARQGGGRVQIVELPPGPPVLSSLVAEVYGTDSMPYSSLIESAQTVANRLNIEPGVSEIETTIETPVRKWTFVPDQEKSALAGISVGDIAATIQTAFSSTVPTNLRAEFERNPLSLTVRFPKSMRSSPSDFTHISMRGSTGNLTPIRELGQWREEFASQTIYHKNLNRVCYVFAECIGRPPADCVIDILFDQKANGTNWVDNQDPRPTASRTFLNNGSGVGWSVRDGVRVTFAGEGEWKITLDVFRDLGLAFGAAMLMIYIILVAQTGSFLVPMVVMLAIPLTALGVMPGFYLLSSLLSSPVHDYSDPVYFTATAMIGMIALSGIVTRDSIILVDFMQQAVANGRPLVDAILESRVVRLRPILLTAGAALLSALPITLDPIFSGLGWSLIFGLIASTLFTLFVIPVTYWLLYAKNEP